ncbi:hypothetical protein [Trichocoleus sp. FACHB-262]|uniref:hypothetical protein n=1 Tax=Trichocoleus sp. FACHB-262 TaxID=2692869 RepID=UPI00168679D3|nr:hypothetical protein [Trichocoleus sp. FACHB-262]MBD2121333.1 hypothetical protein [Trichocoleus sp. FACHB-262]
MRPGLGGQAPAIALSSSIKLEESQAAFAYGFQQFLLKPIDLDDLVDAIIALLKRSNAEESISPLSSLGC